MSLHDTDDLLSVSHANTSLYLAVRTHTIGDERLDPNLLTAGPKLRTPVGNPQTASTLPERIFPRECEPIEPPCLTSQRMH